MTTYGTILTFQKKSKVPGLSRRTRVPSSPKNFGCPKVVPWDTNPWNSWDWDKNRWDSPGTFSFGTQIPRTKILGTVSSVPCPSLLFTRENSIILISKLINSNAVGWLLIKIFRWSLLSVLEFSNFHDGSWCNRHHNFRCSDSQFLLLD